MQLSPSVCHSIQTAQLVLVYILVFTGVFLVSACPQVFQEMWRSSGKTARQIIQEKDLGLVSDTAQLHSICQKVVDLHPDEVSARMQILTCNPFFLFLFCMFEMFCVCCVSLQVDAIRNGNKKVLNKLMGLVQKETKGRADPVLVRAILQEKTS